MGDKSNTLLIIQILVAIAATVCTGVVIRKVISFHANLVVAALLFVGCVAAFTYLSIALPLSFFAESEKTQLNLTIDLMMFSSIGLIIIGIACFAIDHMFERPTFLVIAAAAILSIGVSPFLYSLRQDSFNSSYKIKIVTPEPTAVAVTYVKQPDSFQ